MINYEESYINSPKAKKQPKFGQDSPTSKFSNKKRDKKESQEITPKNSTSKNIFGGDSSSKQRIETNESINDDKDSAAGYF